MKMSHNVKQINYIAYEIEARKLRAEALKELSASISKKITQFFKNISNLPNNLGARNVY